MGLRAQSPLKDILERVFYHVIKKVANNSSQRSLIEYKTGSSTKKFENEAYHFAFLPFHQEHLQYMVEKTPETARNFVTKCYQQSPTSCLTPNFEVCGYADCDSCSKMWNVFKALQREQRKNMKLCQDLILVCSSSLFDSFL